MVAEVRAGMAFGMRDGVGVRKGIATAVIDPGVIERGAIVRAVLRTSFQSSAALFCRLAGARATARVSARSMWDGNLMPCAAGVGRRFSSSACSTMAPESASRITRRSESTSIMTSAIA